MQLHNAQYAENIVAAYFCKFHLLIWSLYCTGVQMTYKTALSVHAFVELFPASIQQIALQKLKNTLRFYCVQGWLNYVTRVRVSGLKCSKNCCRLLNAPWIILGLWKQTVRMVCGLNDWGGGDKQLHSSTAAALHSKLSPPPFDYPDELKEVTLYQQQRSS